MKKRILAGLLALMTLFLCGCGISLPEFRMKPTPSPEPAVATPAPQSTASITVHRTESGSMEESQPKETPPVQTETAEAPAEPLEAPVAAAPLADRVETEVPDLELVRVLNYIPDLKVDLKYATEDNYTGEVIYDFDEPYLRYGTVKKLAAAKEQLRLQGYDLVVWDAYRPASAQFRLFDAHPDGAYVANPYGGGHSSHSSGGTVDVTLMKDGKLVEMPSEMDEFSPLGDRDYRDVSAEAAANARLLEKIMTENGFTGYFGEWWHYTDNTGYNYADVEGVVLPEHGTRVYESVCNEYINIRRVANTSAEAIGNIPNGEKMMVLSYLMEFAHVQYGETEGYVNVHYTKPIF